VLDKIRTEISEYGSIWVDYKITGRRDKDIEQLVSDVLSQAKKQVLDVIDKYKAESEDIESLESAINIMRKYQKIEQIANDKNINGDLLRMSEIRWVLENGKID
jgi:hypothetical protein